MFPSVSQLDGFTDVFGDEAIDENFSQPFSLPTTCDSPPKSLTNGLETNSVEIIRPLKHTGQHGEFRSVEEIDPKYRCLFTYPYFNLVQSRIIEDALYSDKSLVVCAPTGSGKTVVFELAILQLLMQIEDERFTKDFKIIYMAPVKAVCNERLTEWYPKLTKLGLLCIEVTGDTEVDFAQLAPYRVIITTPEKWDILTRRWRDHRGLVEMIKLFLIDEVHILNDESRGPVLEAVVSRMKTVESAAQSAHRIEQLQQQYQGTEVTHSTPPRIRFVAVSATVSNPEDVADWLGTSEKPAVFHKFGDECRPVRLKRIVEGYPCAEGTSIFKFDLILNYKLWPIIQKYYNGKPTLIFCNTRKSVALTAEALSREVTVSFSPEQKAKLTALASTLKNKKLQMLVMSGVGCHHAGLLYEERVNIEQAFRNRDLPILITTTTLAMGVNLPAHLVIVKNTQQYVNGAYQEYSISTVLQMVGRAGRPQFDTEATAVIMTRFNDKPRYQALVGGSEPLQSYLHKRLAENLNSEAALGTVTDVAQCVEWLRSTFLYVRAARDPKRYLGLPSAAPTQLILKKLEELCVKAMNSLASSGLITMDEASCIESTAAGRLMSLFYLDVETMKNIMKIEGTETLERLLWLVCESHELSDMYLRMDERRCLNLLNRNNKAPTIRFPMKGKISTRQMKLSCIIQATLGCLPIPEPALNQEAMKVMKTATRVCKCLVKYITRPELVTQQPQCFRAVFNSIVLTKCIEAHLWENSPYVSKQLKGIGPTFSTLLASAGVTSFMILEERHPRDLERIMNKGPPAGNIIRKQVSLLPKYQLTVTPIDSRSINIHLMLLNHAHLSENMNQLTAGDGHKSYLIVGDSENHLLSLIQFTDKDFISVYDGSMRFEVTRKVSSEHKILIHYVSSIIVGVDAEADYLFLDLEPQSRTENDHALWSNADVTGKNTPGKQTIITDVYKERKRKYNCDNDITQSKEKRKREYNLVQKLQALKECFGKTSKVLKTDLDKSVAMSNKVIHDLMDEKSIPVSPLKYKKAAAESPMVDLTKNVAHPLIIVNEEDDYIDDLQIDSILSKIESEISGNNDATSKTKWNTGAHETGIPTLPRAYGSSIRPEKIELMNINNTRNFINDSSSVKSSKRLKNINMKTNYSFIDLIEKKEQTNDINTNADKSIDSGFSDIIKSQVNKFLEQAQNKTILMPVIDGLIQTSEEELPEVYVKSPLASEANGQIEGDGQDLSDQCSDKTKKIIAGGNLDMTGIKEIEIEHPLEPNTRTEKQEHTTGTDVNKLDKTSMECNIMVTSSIRKANNDNDQYDEFPKITKDHIDLLEKLSPSCNTNNNSYEISPVKSLQTIKNPSDVITRALLPYNQNVDNIEKNDYQSAYDHKSLNIGQKNVCGENNMMVKELAIPYQYDHKHVANNKDYSESIAKLVTSHKTRAIQSSITNLKTLTSNGNVMQSNYRPSRLPYNVPSVVNKNELSDAKNVDNNALEFIKTSDKDPKVSLPFTDKISTTEKNTRSCIVSHQNAFVQDDMTGYYLKNVSNHAENCNNNSNTNGDTLDKIGTVKSSVTNVSLFTDSESSIRNNYQPDHFPYDAYRNKHPPGTKQMLEQKRHENNSSQEETYFKRYTYTATKVDVCTKKYAPDHELRITRKLKLDVDVTEVTKQDKSKTNKKDTNKRDTEQVDNKQIYNNEINNICENTTPENISDTAYSNNKHNDEFNHTEYHDEERKTLDNFEENQKSSTANNSIGNILQKYSRLLAKTDTQTSIVNKTNKKLDSNTGVPKSTDSSVFKTRKPFRISEIYNMDVPLPDNLTNACRSAPAADTIETGSTVKVIPTENQPQSLELFEPQNINSTPKTNHYQYDKPYESPPSVHILKLDPLEDIKDESMFNPKLLLQYCTEDSQEGTDIITPPAPFIDNMPTYSSTLAKEGSKTEFYENIDLYSNDMENMRDDFNSRNFDNYPSGIGLSPKVETWCLSRDDDDTYVSQPVSSVPWISQRAHSSQANTSLGLQRAKLCQFKFVRKKTFRPYK